MGRLPSVTLAAAIALIAFALPPEPAAAQSPLPRPAQLPPPGGQAQPPQRQTQSPAQQRPPQAAQQPQPAPAAPYRPVTIKPPPEVKDPSFAAFRRQLGEIAERKDRAALARLTVAQGFFWLGEQGDKADKRRPGIDNLVKALNLTAPDGSGWEILAGYAADPTASPMEDRRNVSCAPADPVFDGEALEALIQSTRTDLSDWGFTMQPGVEVRSGRQPNAPVIEKLGMHFVRVIPESEQVPLPSPDAPPPPLQIVTPSGKLGYVPAEAISPLGGDQICYVKEAGGWKIAGFIGGEP